LVCCWQQHLLRHIRAIAAEAKQELMNAFRREMTLQLKAISRDKSTSGHFRRRLQCRKKNSAMQQKTEQQSQSTRYDARDVEY